MATCSYMDRLFSGPTLLFLSLLIDFVVVKLNHSHKHFSYCRLGYRDTAFAGILFSSLAAMQSTFFFYSCGSLEEQMHLLRSIWSAFYAFVSLHNTADTHAGTLLQS